MPKARSDKSDQLHLQLCGALHASSPEQSCFSPGSPTSRQLMSPLRWCPLAKLRSRPPSSNSTCMGNASEPHCASEAMHDYLQLVLGGMRWEQIQVGPPRLTMMVFQNPLSFYPTLCDDYYRGGSGLCTRTVGSYELTSRATPYWGSQGCLKQRCCLHIRASLANIKLGSRRVPFPACRPDHACRSGHARTQHSNDAASFCSAASHTVAWSSDSWILRWGVSGEPGIAIHSKEL